MARARKLALQMLRILCTELNENGPCPMLALANVLLLRGGIEIHPDYSEVTFEASPRPPHTHRRSVSATHTHRHNVLGASTGPVGEAGRAHA